MPIATLFDDKEEDDEEQDDRNGLYTGGNRRGGGGSGLAVIGGDDDPDADAVTRMFRQAQRNAAGNGEGPEEGADQVKITVYSNGFVVGDGRSDPLMALRRTRRFCAMLGEAVVPRELEDRAGAGAVNLELVDKRGGVRYGPGLPACLLRRRPDASLHKHVGVSFAEASCDKPALDDGKPKTTLQVRLSNGKRARVTLNLDNTVAQLDALIRADHGAEGSYQFWRASRPRRSRTPRRRSRRPGLKGASVTQKAA